MTKNKLYFFILTACFFGYSWLFFLKSVPGGISNQDFSVCLSKKITTIPCPSCGTTRAVNHLFNGELLASLFINPFGIIVSGIMLIAPLWILFDFFTEKDTFYNFYGKTEVLIRTKKIAFPLIFLVILNWIWNIYKQL
jgi:hypothetical protein